METTIPPAKRNRSINYLFIFLFIALTNSLCAKAGPVRYYYQLKIYHFKNAESESRLDAYLQGAYLPALHKAGIKMVGVFKPVEQDSLDRKIYVLVPYRSWDELETTDEKLLTDQHYLIAGKDYINANYDQAPYARIETIITRAFVHAPEPNLPDLTGKKTDRIYELRSYEGATEKLHASKVKMFNAGDEMAIFKKYGMNGIFYAEVIAGSHMPNLMYMTSYNTKKDNIEKWKQFMQDSKFIALSKMPEYQHNVSKVERFFLYPVVYSDF